MPLSPTRIMHRATLEANVHSKRKVLPSMTLCRQAWKGGCQCLHMLSQNLTRNFATGARQTYGTASNPHSALCYTGSDCASKRTALPFYDPLSTRLARKMPMLAFAEPELRPNQAKTTSWKLSFSTGTYTITCHWDIKT